MQDWSEKKLKKEAKRLGWSVEVLKAHIRKEDAIKKHREQKKKQHAWARPRNIGNYMKGWEDQFEKERERKAEKKVTNELILTGLELKIESHFKEYKMIRESFVCKNCGIILSMNVCECCGTDNIELGAGFKEKTKIWLTKAVSIIKQIYAKDEERGEFWLQKIKEVLKEEKFKVRIKEQ